ncbi:MAG: aromatic amino acid lyase [Ignavibacteria bacterium]|nr:aromatic amino acid lyase [Ignavibacteria bacterium]
MHGRKKSIIHIDGHSLDVQTITAIAYGNAENFEVRIKPSAKKGIKASRNYIDSIVKQGGSGLETPYIYGVNTGFGANKHNFIDAGHGENLSRIAYNLIASHATGHGEKFARHVVRAAMLLRANTLVTGYSGIREEVIEKLLWLLNNDITPVVPCQGSVGGSGDLAPLSHMVLPFILNPYSPEDPLQGDVEFYIDGEYKIVMAQELRNVIQPIILQAKEGLALNNGTQFLNALTCLAAVKGNELVLTAQIAAALTCDALLSTFDAFQPIIHQLRPYKGQTAAANNMRAILKGSTLIFDPSREFDYLAYRKDIEVQKIEIALGVRKKLHPVKEPIQDVYSVRCSPQVIGAVWDTVHYVSGIVKTEANSVNDNPIINVMFDDSRLNGKAVSGGNFHGEPVALAADYLKIALTELGSVSERRVAAMVDPAFNRRLPAFLSPEVSPQGDPEHGMHSGFMIPQYLCAALVSENRVLAHPASVDSIPTSAGTEDHVSMGTHGARQALQILDNTKRVIGVELLSAAQGIELRLRQSLQELYDLDMRIEVLEALEGVLDDTRINEALGYLRDLEKSFKSAKARLQPGKGSSIVLEIIRTHLHERKLTFPITNDVYMQPYIQAMVELIDSGVLLRALQSKVTLEILH